MDYGTFRRALRVRRARLQRLGVSYRELTRPEYGGGDHRAGTSHLWRAVLSRVDRQIRLLQREAVHEERRQVWEEARRRALRRPRPVVVEEEEEENQRRRVRPRLELAPEGPAMEVDEGVVEEEEADVSLFYQRPLGAGWTPPFLRHLALSPVDREYKRMQLSFDPFLVLVARDFLGPNRRVNYMAHDVRGEHGREVYLPLPTAEGAVASSVRLTQYVVAALQHYRFLYRIEMFTHLHNLAVSVTLQFPLERGLHPVSLATAFIRPPLVTPGPAGWELMNRLHFDLFPARLDRFFNVDGRFRYIDSDQLVIEDPYLDPIGVSITIYQF